jgi:hypothetical protein
MLIRWPASEATVGRVVLVHPRHLRLLAAWVAEATARWPDSTEDTHI